MSTTQASSFSAEGPPPVTAHAWTMPKGGESTETYEDAASVRPDAWSVRGAVADGATESVFARSWAECLAQGLVERAATTLGAFRDAVPEWQGAWTDAVRERAGGRPWYVKAKAEEEGAFAALLGLTLRTGGRWRAVSVGDCCLFQVRDGALVRSWPFGAADEFTNRPALVPSRPERELPRPEFASGTWAPGDTILLATDAAAAWLLSPGSSVGPADAGAWNEAQCRRAVERGRAAGTLRNDDTTLLVLHVDDAPR